jgi:hypothetical protein
MAAILVDAMTNSISANTRIGQLSEAFDPHGEPRVERIESRFRIILPRLQFLGTGGAALLALGYVLGCNFSGIAVAMRSWVPSALGIRR